MEQFCDFTVTRAYAGYWLRRVTGPIPSLILAAAVLGPLGFRAEQNGDLTPVIIAAALITWAIVTLRRFLRDVLENDQLDPLFPENAAEELSAELLGKLRGRSTVDLWTLLSAISATRRGSYIIREIGFRREEFLRRCEPLRGQSIDIAACIASARSSLSLTGERRVNPGMLFAALCDAHEPLRSLLDAQNLSSHDLQGIIRMEWLREKLQNAIPGALSPHALFRIFGSVGQSWVKGYTDELDSITEDIGAGLQWGSKPETIIHRQELNDAMKILSRGSRHNVLFVGKRGVGKRTLVQNLAYVIRTYEAQQGLPFTRILVLNIERLLSGSVRPDQQLLRAFGGSAQKESFILVIQNLPLLLQAADPLLKAVLIKLFLAGNILTICITDHQSYHTLVKADPGIDATFEKVNIPDATEGETMDVLMEYYFHLERSHGTAVTFRALKSVIELAKRYLGESGFPGAAIEVIDDALIEARRQSDAYVGDAHVRQAISLKAHVDIRGMQEGERTQLLNLESELRKKIIGQDEAVNAVVHAFRRARMEIGGGSKPYGTFLFLGSTGVGKTHTAKVIAEQLFGSAGSLIRLDMNEYSTEASVQGVIGAAGAGQGYLTQRVQDKPFSLILLDEIEKAHRKVLNLFLQILDEGFVVDWKGEKTDFRNSVIIATSNAGALFIRDFVRQRPDWTSPEGRKAFHDTIVEKIVSEGTYSPEFLNRFDQVVVYYPLSMESARKVAEIMLNGVIAEFREKKGIAIDVESGVVDVLTERGYSLDFGAREMRRTITDTIENFLADELLRHEVKHGDRILIRREDLPQT